MNPSRLSLIAAVAQNGAIGKDNSLLWHISDDLKHFKELTTGHPVIMGRRTFESLPVKPLPKRRNIVLTRDTSFSPAGVEIKHTVSQILDAVRDGAEAFVIGGAAVYRLLLPYAQHLYITWVYRDFDADAFFPDISHADFRQDSLTPRRLDPASGLVYAYAEYSRIIS